MKVITEERLIVLEAHFNSFGIYPTVAIRDLINECQELDTLTVTRLRPMSDIPIGEPILMKTKLMDGFYATVISDDDDLDGCDGWIPMPRYEPEKV